MRLGVDIVDVAKSVMFTTAAFAFLGLFAAAVAYDIAFGRDSEWPS